MDNIIIKKRVVPTEKEVEDLYNDANWTSYTNDLPLLVRAIKESLFVVTAWDKENLVGLIRIVGELVSFVKFG